MLRDKKNINSTAFKRCFDYYVDQCEIYKLGNDVSRFIYVLVMRYVRGDPFDEIRQQLLEIIPILLRHKRLLVSVDHQYPDFESTTVDIYCLMAFAMALNVDGEYWQVLNNDLFEPAGSDWLLDRLVSQRSLQRGIGDLSKWKKSPNGHYYGVLHDVIESEGKLQQLAIKKHLKKWHSNRNQGHFRMMIAYGTKPDSPESSYIGQFAFELAAVVMAFDIDDSAFCEDIYYPKELVEHWRAHRTL